MYTLTTHALFVDNNEAIAEYFAQVAKELGMTAGTRYPEIAEDVHDIYVLENGKPDIIEFEAIAVQFFVAEKTPEEAAACIMQTYGVDPNDAS